MLVTYVTRSEALAFQKKKKKNQKNPAKHNYQLKLRNNQTD